MAEPLAIFVYGTLKRGEVRERCWRRQPVKIEPATVRGWLYDLGPYPALVEGSETISGELWHFAVDDLPAVLAALDKVEGYSGGANDLYHRIVIECRTGGRSVRAWTYIYAQPNELTETQRVLPNQEGLCVWSRPGVPTSDLRLPIAEP